MDEDFFVYHEEHDYCYRVGRAGYHLLLEPRAKVWHKVSLSSGGSDSSGARYWMAKNIWFFFRKHAAWWQWFFIIPWRAGSAFKTTVRLSRQRHWKALRAYWRGLRDGLCSPLTRGRSPADPA
jgi:GT2 family glycosyltransferase